VKRKIGWQTANMRKLKESHRKKMFKKLSHDGGVTIRVDENSAFIFSKEHQKNDNELLDKEVSKDSLAHYVFAESVRKLKIAASIGANLLRHCPLTIRGILVRSKMGFAGGLYDLLANIVGLLIG